MSESSSSVPANAAADASAAMRCIGSGTEMRDLVRGFDWGCTSLGPMSGWPGSLRAVVCMMINAVQPMVLWWGDDLVQIYNDAYRPSLGRARHPEALGASGPRVWAESWPVIGPQIDSVRAGAAATWYQDHLVPVLRNGRIEESYWSYSITPVFDEADAVSGVLAMCTETTSRVLVERRRETLDFLSRGMAGCCSLDDILHHVRLAAASNPKDLPAISVNGTGGSAGAAQVRIAASELNLDVGLVLTFDLPAAQPFDLPYRLFLEQFTTIAGTALGRIESDAAQALALAERDRLLLDAPVGAAVMIGEDLVYYLVNSLYAQISGRPAANMVGKPFAEVFPELGDASVYRTFLDVYRAGEPHVGEETLVPIHRNGGELEDRYFTFNLSPLRRLDGTVYGLMVIAVDITQQVRARFEIEHLNQQLHAAARAKDEFLALLGHELRNPLAPIVTALELMKFRESATTREQAVIRRQVTHLTRLVDDLLDVSRITRGKVELRKSAVDVRAVAAEAVEMVSPLMEQRRHRLTVDVPSVQWYGDPSRLAQIISNLLTNAARYTQDHGSIEFTGRVQDGWVELQVSDNGMGIPEALLSRIFEPFVQGERKLANSAGGLGIGLALVKNLAEMHDGEVMADSRGPGLGSTFTVRLPLGATTAADEQAPAVSAQLAAPERPQHVLVVDDNADAADFLAELLRSLGHRVTVAYDPAQALDQASRVMPELAILDIGLPGMSGYELAEHLRQLPHGREPTYVALTGFGQTDDRARSQAEGFAAHLVKPVDLNELQSILQAARAQA